MDPGDTTVAVVAVYSTCLTGLKALTDAVEVPRGTEALWQQMRIQAARLRIWGEQWGMNEYTDCSTGRPASDTELLAYKNLREFLTEWPATGELMEKALYGIVEFLVNKRKLEEKFGFARWKVPVAVCCSIDGGGGRSRYWSVVGWAGENWKVDSRA